MNALKLKRDTLYRTTANCEEFPVGTLVKRCKWVLDYRGDRVMTQLNDDFSVAFRKKGSRKYQDFAYLSADEVEEV